MHQVCSGERLIDQLPHIYKMVHWTSSHNLNFTCLLHIILCPRIVCLVLTCACRLVSALAFSSGLVYLYWTVDVYRVRPSRLRPALSAVFSVFSSPDRVRLISR